MPDYKERAEMKPPVSSKLAKKYAEEKAGLRERNDYRTRYAKLTAVADRIRCLGFRDDIMCKQIVSTFPKDN